MKLPVLLISAASVGLLVGGTVLAQTSSTQSTRPSASSSSTTQQGRVTTNQFVRRAAISDMFEVDSSKLALQKTQDSSIKAFAQQMVTAHTESTQKLKDTIKSAKIKASVPTKLDKAHAGNLDKLKKASAADFDKSYVQMQVKGHQDALKLMQTYSKSGDNTALKQFASTMAPIIQSHLDEAQKLAQGNSGGMGAGAMGPGGAGAMGGSTGSGGTATPGGAMGTPNNRGMTNPSR
jgi:putative membrane protein